MKTLKFLLVSLALVNLNTAHSQTIAEGMKYLENENYKAALAAFTDLATKEPTNPIYQYYIGEVKYATEDYPAAEKAYNEGLKISPKCSECSIGLGKLKLDQGNMIEAQPLFDAAVKANKKSAAVLALIGKSFLNSKKPNAVKAIDYLGRSRDMAPKVATTLSMLGDAYKLNNDLGNAMTQYETSVELDPKNIEAVMSQARIWASAKQVELAIKKLEEALKLNTDYAPAYKDLYELYIRERKFDKVVPLLDKYVTLVGNDIDAKVRLVKFLCFQAKDYDRAISEGQKLLATNPEQYTLYRWLAWSYGEKEKWQETYDNSIKLFDASKADPSRKLYQSDTAYYAKAVFGIGKLDEAEGVFSDQIKQNPSIALETYDKFAKAYYAKKNYDKAIEYYNKKNTVKALSSNDLVFLGLSQVYSNKLVDADSSFARSLAINPDYPYGWSQRIRIANKMDTISTNINTPATVVKPWLAKPLYEKYIQYASVDPVKNKAYLIDAYHYLAFYSVQNTDNENAKLYYSKVLELKPDDTNAMENLKILNTPQSNGKKTN
jgi:tetratricopeptide (TPR) repeat protein